MINKIDALTDSEFIELINSSSNTADVLKKLDYTVKGNSWAYNIIADRMDELNICFHKKENNYSKYKEKLPLSSILTVNSGYNRTKLKSRLLDEGLKENKCEICGLSEWNGKPISLQLHHLNGINNDNRIENLQLLCPNCHSQTENFGTKGKGRVLRKKINQLSEDKIEFILNTVKEKGIVQARKILPFRNSIINAIVKNNSQVIIMTTPDNTEMTFHTTYETAKYLISNSIGKNIESVRVSISKCLNNKQKSIKGYTFKRSAVK